MTTNDQGTKLTATQDHDKETRQTQETVLYASVNKQKKRNYDPSSSKSPKETTSNSIEQPADASRNQLVSAEQTVLGAKADLKIPHANKPQIAVKDTSDKEGCVTEQHPKVKDPTREPPSRPVPYHTSREQLFEKEEGPLSTDNKTPLSKIQTDGRPQGNVYAEISTYRQTKDPGKQPGQDSKLSTVRHV